MCVMAEHMNPTSGVDSSQIKPPTTFPESPRPPWIPAGPGGPWWGEVTGHYEAYSQACTDLHLHLAHLADAFI